jgi:hypothetical protein
MAEVAKEKHIYCNRCKGVTRHRLTGSHEYSTDVEEGEYRLWACAGCDTGLMEDCYTAAYHHSDAAESILYPKRAEHERPRKYFTHLPKKLADLYAEVVSANNSDLNILCAIGLTGLIEGICADKKLQGDNLDERVEAMKALLPQNIVRTLHDFRFIGNRAAHELEAPQSGELGNAIDLIEDILNYLYDLDYKARLFSVRHARQKEQS